MRTIFCGKKGIIVGGKTDEKDILDLVLKTSSVIRERDDVFNYRSESA